MEKTPTASRYEIFWDSIQVIIAVLKLALKILDTLLMGMKNIVSHTKFSIVDEFTNDHAKN